MRVNSNNVPVDLGQTTSNFNHPAVSSFRTGFSPQSIVTRSVLVAVLFCAAVALGQQDDTQSTLAIIKSQVNQLKSRLAAGEMNPQEGNAQIKALQLLAGELMLNSSSLNGNSSASVQQDLASATKPRNPGSPPTQGDPRAVTSNPGKDDTSNIRVQVASADPPPGPAASALPSAASDPAGATSAVLAPAAAVASTPNAAICGSLCGYGMTHFRGLIGVNVAGASGADPSAKFYANAAFELPLGGDLNAAPLVKKTAAGEQAGTPAPLVTRGPAWFSLWGNLGLSSISQPGSLSGVTDQYAYLKTAVSTSPQQIVQSVETQFGLSVNPPAWRWFHANTDSFQTLSLIAGLGVNTPLSASQAAPPLYVVTQDVVSSYINQYPGLKSACNLDASNNLPSGQKCYVAFFPQDRTRFFRDYGVGVRMKFFWPDPDKKNILQFPGNIDLAVGQIEYVTGGGFNGAVVHVGGAMPIVPIHGLYAFGSMDVALSKGAAAKSPLLLQPSAAPSVAYTDPSVVNIQVPQPNRDRYTIGMGFDVVDFFSHFNSKKGQ